MCCVCEIYKAVCLITTCTCHKTYAKMRNVAKSAAQHAWPVKEIPPQSLLFFCMPSRYTARAYSYSYRLPVAALVYSIYVITFSNAFFARVPEIFSRKRRWHFSGLSRRTARRRAHVTWTFLSTLSLFLSLCRWLKVCLNYLSSASCTISPTMPTIFLLTPLQRKLELTNILIAGSKRMQRATT